MTKKMSKDEEIKVIDEFIEKIAPYITQSPAIAEEIKALIHFYEKTGQKLTPVQDMTEAERQAIWKRLKKQIESKPALREKLNKVKEMFSPQQERHLRMAAKEQSLEQILGATLIGFKRPILSPDQYSIVLEIEENELYIVFLQHDSKTSNLDDCTIRLYTEGKPESDATSTIQDGKVKLNFDALGLKPEEYEQVCFIIETAPEPLKGTLGNYN